MSEEVSIICADDDEAARTIYKNVFKNRYKNVRIFADGKSALDAFQQQPADLMILDVAMPGGMSGMDVSREIRRLTGQQSTTVIMVSANDSESNIIQGFQAGADDYLTKPLNPSVLLAKINVILTRKAATLSSKMTHIFPGSVFAGKYEIIDKIGSGSFGCVYQAKDVTASPSVEVALKIFDLPQSKLQDNKFKAMFLREAYSLSKVDTKNVVKLYDFGAYDFYYLAMEFLRGHTLQDRIVEFGPMDEANTQIVAYELAKILRHMEQRSLVHRDIKPVNIMITVDGIIKLLDFGLARAENEGTIMEDDAFRGTPLYAAPESMYGDTGIDIKSDIFSLGATLYYCSIGRPPFEGKTAMEVLEYRMKYAPRPINELNPKLSVDFSKLINDMIHYEQEKRPSPDEVVERLREMQ